MVFSAAACGKKEANTAAPSSSASSTTSTVSLKPKNIDMAQVKGKSNRDLVVASSGDTTTLDYIEAGNSAAVEVLRPVMETLVRYNEQGKLVPWLASSYKRLDDRSWEFKLRKGVKFQNGEEMKASDVIFSMKRATTPAAANVAYIMSLIDPNGFEAPDDYTVIVRTKIPFGSFIGYMPYIGASIVSEKAYQSPDASTHPVGTGPYEFVEYKKGQYTKYKAFKDYWGGKPGADTLTIKPIPDVTSRYTALETGEVDIAPVTVNEVGQIQGNNKLNLSSHPTTVFTTLNFNTTKAPFDNVKFRQAIDYAIDEPGIVKSVFRGSAQYTPGPVTPQQQYFDKSAKPKYDVAKAKQLVKESGVDLGKTYEIATSNSQTRIDEATIIQQQLANIGVKTTIRKMESAAYNDYMTGKDKDMFFSGWGAVGFPDPDNNVYGPLYSGGIPDNNTTFYNDPKMDEMLQKERALPNGPEREKLIVDIQQKIREDTPYTTLENTVNIIGYQTYVKGFSAQAAIDQYYNNVSLKTS
jgi:peptide/nickel transport system substrate-binding protein